MSFPVSRSLRLIVATFLLAGLHLSGCGDDSERFERIDKLRALGVATPAAIIASPTATQEATVSFVAALPLGQTVTAAPFVDADSRFATPVTLEVIANDAPYEDHKALRIYKVDAKVSIPPLTSLQKLPDQEGIPVRYGLRLTTGSEEELIVGTLVIYPPGDAQPSFQPLGVNIAKPSNGAAVLGKKEELEASITNPNDENVRVGWFVSTGKIKNRRARVTEWEVEDSGPVSLIATVRGLKSGTFAYKVIDLSH